jgi:hypothetical protein
MTRAERTSAPTQSIFEFLSTWIKHPISLLAVAADYDAGFSGSLVLHWLFPEKHKYFTAKSDLDMYLPKKVEAIQDVRWNTVLHQKVEELENHSVSLVPLKLVLDVAQLLKLDLDPSCALHEYLESRLDDSAASETFIKQFCGALKIVLSNPAQFWNQENKDVLVIRMSNDSEEAKKCVPYAAMNIVEKLVDMIEGWPFEKLSAESIQEDWGEPQLREVAHQYFELESDDTEEDASLLNPSKPTTIDIHLVKSKWLKQKLPVPCVQAFIREEILSKRPYVAKAVIDKLLSLILGYEKPHQRQNEAYHGQRSMLRGTLPDGRRIQLMLMQPEKPMALVKTALGYYATHVMGWISGTTGGHLYYSPAANGKALTLDFKDDPRQQGALDAITKHTDRGWTFTSISTRATDANDIVHRNAKDGEALLVSFKDEYENLISKEDIALPPWWNMYFEEKHRLYTSLRWWEIGSRIKCITHETYHAYGRLINWVHLYMSRHKYVIDHKAWYNPDLVKINLDIHFGGIRFAKGMLPYREVYDGSHRTMTHNGLSTDSSTDSSTGSVLESDSDPIDE